MFEAELKKLNAAAHSTASTLDAGRQAGGGGVVVVVWCSLLELKSPPG